VAGPHDGASGEHSGSGLAALHPRRFFLETWQRIDAEAEAARAARVARAAGPTDAYDFRPLVAYAVGALCLLSLEYWGPVYAWGEWLDALLDAGVGPARLLYWLRHGPFYGLGQFVFWSAWRVAAYFVVPALVIRFVFRERLCDYGLRVAGLRERAGLYTCFGALVLVLVALASGDREFQRYYPFYRLASRSGFDLVVWELLYIAQFFALEFFFRGFLLHACRERFGSHAIFAMLAPYCMIHFGKPWPEALAALPAGLVLGTLALGTRSIAGGVLLHVTVALGMDLMALGRQGGWPDAWWP
jgi:membrane protease YdiL (CAAX protease family)